MICAYSCAVTTPARLQRRSRSPAKTGCTWASMNPGSSVPPRRSTGSALPSCPASSAEPIAEIFPAATRTAVPAGKNLAPSKIVPL